MGITYLVGNIKINLLIDGPLAEVRCSILRLFELAGCIDRVAALKKKWEVAFSSWPVV